MGTWAVYVFDIAILVFSVRDVESEGVGHVAVDVVNGRCGRWRLFKLISERSSWLSMCFMLYRSEIDRVQEDVYRLIKSIRSQQQRKVF